MSDVTADVDSADLWEDWRGLADATGVVRALLARVLHEHGLVDFELDVLIHLAAQPSQRLPMSHLAREVSLTSGGFTKLADRMEQAGLIRREPSAHDRRVVYAVLTDVGRYTLEAARPVAEQALDHALRDSLGEEGLRDLVRLARRLREAHAPSGRVRTSALPTAARGPGPVPAADSDPAMRHFSPVADVRVG